MVTFALRMYACMCVRALPLITHMYSCVLDLNECHCDGCVLVCVCMVVISATKLLSMELVAAATTIAHIRVFTLMISLFSGLTIRPVSCGFLFDYLKL